jgi:thiol:disulfide interchange protein DsbD
MKKILSALLIQFFVSIGFAQIEYPEDKVDWKFSVEQKGCEATVIGTFTVAEHWHINATSLPEDNFGIPTTFKLVGNKNYKNIGNVIEPTPIQKYDKASGENLSYHEGTFTLRQKIKILTKSPFVLALDFGFQPCDSVKCLMPFEDRFEVKVKGCADAGSLTALQEGGDSKNDKTEKASKSEEEELDEDRGLEQDTASASATVKIDSGDVSTEDNEGQQIEAIADEVKDEAEDASSDSLWWIFGVSFASGFLALLTPCVFPMIPMTVSFFTKQSKTKAAGIRNALTYGLSIIVIYITLGTLITWIFGADALNAMSTNPTFNIIFFFLLAFFAISFLGAFEIQLPNSWINKADQRADKGGLIGIFFMALALALVSFSCTGPIVGALLVQAASEGGVAPFVGMFGFSLALALPFGLFAAFPGWMNTLPKSGGWLNVVKVVLGFLELALAFKFLSNADLSLQAHLLERELFLAIWIGIFLVLAIYLLGFIRMPHDSPLEKLSVGRALLGTFTLVFVLYMIPGLWGAPLKIISAFPPPMSYSESPYGVGGMEPVSTSTSSSTEYVEGTVLGPQNIMVFHEYDEALAHAKKVGKPLFVDFTGHNCVNCRKMEQSAWGEPGIIDILREDVVIVSLHVDERKPLPKEEQKTVTYPNGREVHLKTTGQKWSYMQISQYQVTAQPYYILQDTEGNDLSNGSADYQNHSNPAMFKTWLEEGLADFNKQKQ